ncbi:MAG TPA: hypothetical protein VHX61_08295 [Rhizomicrobium sp.]|jgi:hypothetical protein|nr:hypothetical protein [Rhizomicrobium sp.]
MTRASISNCTDYDIRGNNRFIRAVIAVLPPAPPPACARSQSRN